MVGGAGDGLQVFSRSNRLDNSMLYSAESLAKERGRRMAAEALRCHPEKKAELIRRFGERRIRDRYPEAFSNQIPMF